MKSEKLPFTFVIPAPEFFFAQPCLSDDCINCADWNFLVTFLGNADDKLFFLGSSDKNSLPTSVSVKFDSKAFQDLEEDSAGERLRALPTHGT